MDSGHVLQKQKKKGKTSQSLRFSLRYLRANQFIYLRFFLEHVTHFMCNIFNGIIACQLQNFYK